MKRYFYIVAFFAFVAVCAPSVVARADVPYIPTSKFENILAQTKTPVVIQFGADWCPYCRKLQPALSSFAGSNRGKVVVYRINIDEEREVADFYRISSLPTLILFNGGSEFDRIAGVPTEEELQGWVDQLQ